MLINFVYNVLTTWKSFNREEVTRSVMTVRGLIFAVTFKIICVQSVVSRMIPFNYLPIQPVLEDSITPTSWEDEPTNKVFSSKEESENEQDTEPFDVSFDQTKQDASKNPVEEVTKKPCSVVVLSDRQNNNMQSLLRKYRYDAKGVLIPSSVKYFIKLPQGLESPPILVPLNDKAFSPLGGFVRYYKEVPPIPRSW